MRKMIVGMFLLVMLLAACQITVTSPDQQRQNTINVNGASQFKAVPDEASLFLYVETNGTLPKEAQDRNSAAMDAVQNALRKAGVADKDMETANYNLYQNVYWDPKLERQVEAGYKASHTLKIRTSELERVGEFIQLAVDAGATRIDSISFSLSKKGERDAKDAAIRQAVEDARQKADAIADSLDLRIAKVMSVSINEYNVIPYYRGGIAMAELSESKAVPPPIAPQEVDVSAGVQVVFEIA